MTDARTSSPLPRAKVLVVGSLDKKTIRELAVQPVVVLVPYSMDDLRAFGGMLYQDVVTQPETRHE